MEMRVTDMITITELSRAISKSRPTVYKYISDYEKGNMDDVPSILKTLFERIEKENISKREVFEYLDKNYNSYGEEKSTLEEIIDLLKENKEKLDLKTLKENILKEINK